MAKQIRIGRIGAVAIGLALLAGAQGGAAPAHAADEAQIRRGEYIFHAADCYACHTDTENHGPTLAGGTAIKTPFGTFYAPNITPDPNFGIGGWSDADFIRALREGVSPDGRNYYPAFPYGSFTNMTDQDMLDLKAYIFSLPAVAAPSHPHQLPFYLRWRVLVSGWKTLNFQKGPLAPDPAKDAVWNRGRYLVEALAHCEECHTPRTLTGGLDRAKAFSGNPDGPDGKPIPNITPDETGIGDWSEVDIAFALKTGQTPDGDVFGSFMTDVVDLGTSYLTDEDRAAIAHYLKSVPPIRHVLPKAD
jgi:mono/diheme cytochrome c family protein